MDDLKDRKVKLLITGKGGHGLDFTPRNRDYPALRQKLWGKGGNPTYSEVLQMLKELIQDA